MSNNKNNKTNAKKAGLQRDEIKEKVDEIHALRGLSSTIKEREPLGLFSSREKPVSADVIRKAYTSKGGDDFSECGDDDHSHHSGKSIFLNVN